VRYDRLLKYIFAVQDEIVAKVLTTLRLILEGERDETAAKVVIFAAGPTALKPSTISCVPTILVALHERRHVCRQDLLDKSVEDL
jgi:hypothetical protein